MMPSTKSFQPISGFSATLTPDFGTNAGSTLEQATMPPTTATVSYDKKDGQLVVSDDKKYVFWTPSGGSSPAVTIPVADITNLQQTPATSKNIALKVVVKDSNYVFKFTHKEKGRQEQENVTGILRDTIQVNKTKENAVPLAKDTAPGTPTTAAEDAGQSAAMAIAKAISSKAADEGWYDDTKLKNDDKLQRSLLESNKALRDRFNQALRDKPESVSISQFTSQFWGARLHLLRAHAIENAQKQGEYNVLPEIKFVRKPAEKEGEPDTKMLSITKEQIKLIFKQYPIVREAYDENVPPMRQDQFWTRFFQSRLLKKLKGEKITQQDERDQILDKYLDRPEAGPALIGQVPHWMDLEGNEQNHSQRKGNRPDEDMRPSKVPILRVLNNLSEKMMQSVAPEDGEAHAPIGLDEETFAQLRLRDLAREDVDNRIVLNIREQQRYAGGQQDDLSLEAKLYAQQDPEVVLSTLRSDLQPKVLGSDETGTLRLDQVIGYHTDDDSDSEDEVPSHQANGTAPKKKKKAAKRVGSHAAMSAASNSVMSSIKQRRHAASSDPTSLNGLSQATFDTLTMTHNTTTEFLHYFWTLFLSGDASRVAELAQLVQTLDRSVDRINAVMETAEKERDRKIDEVKRADQEHYERTKKRRRRDFSQVPGGKKVVETMVRPTLKAIEQATNAYRKALEEQTREANAAGLS